MRLQQLLLMGNIFKLLFKYMVCIFMASILMVLLSSFYMKYGLSIQVQFDKVVLVMPNYELQGLHYAIAMSFVWFCLFGALNLWTERKRLLYVLNNMGYLSKHLRGIVVLSFFEKYILEKNNSTLSMKMQLLKKIIQRLRYVPPYDPEKQSPYGSAYFEDCIASIDLTRLQSLIKSFDDLYENACQLRFSSGMTFSFAGMFSSISLIILYGYLNTSEVSIFSISSVIFIIIGVVWGILAGDFIANHSIMIFEASGIEQILKLDVPWIFRITFKHPYAKILKIFVVGFSITGGLMLAAWLQSIKFDIKFWLSSLTNDSYSLLQHVQLRYLLNLNLNLIFIIWGIYIVFFHRSLRKKTHALIVFLEQSGWQTDPSNNSPLNLKIIKQKSKQVVGASYLNIGLLLINVYLPNSENKLFFTIVSLLAGCGYNRMVCKQLGTIYNDLELRLSWTPFEENTASPEYLKSKIQRLKFDVFLSYKSEDAELVRKVADQLIASRLNVWFAEYLVRLTNRSDFQALIDQGIRQTQYGIVFSNYRYTTSKWCKLEIEQLLGEENCGSAKIVEVKLEDEPSLHSMYPKLGEAKSIVFDGDFNNLINQIRMNTCLKIDEVIEANNQDTPHYIYHDDRGDYRLNMTGWHMLERRGILDHVGLSGPVFERKLASYTMYCSIAIGKSAVGVELEQPDTTTVLDLNWIKTVLSAACSVPNRVSARQQVVDDREFYDQMVKINRRFSEKFKISSENVRGVHLFFFGGRSHFAITYWTDNGWSRRYNIILPVPGTEENLDFMITFRLFGPFSELCRYTCLMEDVVHSLH